MLATERSCLSANARRTTGQHPPIFIRRMAAQKGCFTKHVRHIFAAPAVGKIDDGVSEPPWYVEGGVKDIVGAAFAREHKTRASRHRIPHQRRPCFGDVDVHWVLFHLQQWAHMKAYGSCICA